jgi:hypothetical protein
MLMPGAIDKLPEAVRVPGRWLDRAVTPAATEVFAD